jgi:hypothetical protein
MRTSKDKQSILDRIAQEREKNKPTKTMQQELDKLPEPIINATMQDALYDIQMLCFARAYNAGWHTNLETGELLERNRAEMLCLIHSEISEAMEGERKNLMDDKLPHRPMAEVELADAVIRIFDYAGRWGYDLAGALFEKLEFNKTRIDHQIENRRKENGKKF